MDRSVIDEWNDDFECFTGCWVEGLVEVSGISILLSGWMIVDLGGGGWLGVLLMEIGNSSNMRWDVTLSILYKKVWISGELLLCELLRIEIFRNQLIKY